MWDGLGFLCLGSLRQCVFEGHGHSEGWQAMVTQLCVTLWSHCPGTDQTALPVVCGNRLAKCHPSALNQPSASWHCPVGAVGCRQNRGEHGLGVLRPWCQGLLGHEFRDAQATVPGMPSHPAISVQKGPVAPWLCVTAAVSQCSVPVLCAGVERVPWR